MSSTSRAGGTANNAQVHAGDSPTSGDARARDARGALADDAERAVDAIERKIAGMKESLATAKAEAKRLRAEAQKGGQG